MHHNNKSDNSVRRMCNETDEDPRLVVRAPLGRLGVEPAGHGNVLALLSVPFVHVGVYGPMRGFGASGFIRPAGNHPLGHPLLDGLQLAHPLLFAWDLARG